MRIRVISRGMYGLLYMRKLFNPFKHGFVSFQLLSHKVMRWMIPFGLPLLLVSNLALVGRPFYDLALMGQAAILPGRGRGVPPGKEGEKGETVCNPPVLLRRQRGIHHRLFPDVAGRKSVVWETGRG